MIYAEAAYFDGAYVAHIAAWEERQRRERARRWAERNQSAIMRLVRAGRLEMADQRP